MKDRIANAREFVERHRTAFVFGAGAVAGAAGMLRLMTNQDIFLAVSPEKLQMLIDKPGGALRWEHNRITVTVLNELNPTL